MSRVFVDTSAFYAALCSSDGRHLDAQRALQALRDEDVRLESSGFVIHETVSLLQARLGLPAVQAFHSAVLPAVHVHWQLNDLFERAMGALLAADSRGLSLTDHASFVLMRDQGIHRAFAFDGDFARAGFELVPSSSP